jgi:DNA-directed RNA polymerase subunit M/transcription elongation factor TFIIS
LFDLNPSPAETDNNVSGISDEPQNIPFEKEDASVLSVKEIEEPQRFTCSQCPKFFEQKWKLNKHVKEVHDKRKSKHVKIRNGDYPCPICKLRSVTMYAHKCHLMTSHIDLFVF